MYSRWLGPTVCEIEASMLTTQANDNRIVITLHRNPSKRQAAVFTYPIKSVLSRSVELPRLYSALTPTAFSFFGDGEHTTLASYEDIEISITSKSHVGSINVNVDKNESIPGWTGWPRCKCKGPFARYTTFSPFRVELSDFGCP